MKKFTKLLCLVLVLCTLVCFAACKKKNAASAATTELPTDTGVCYYLAGAKYGDEKVWPLSDLQISDPNESYIYFDPSGMGVLCIDTWDIYFEYADGQLWDELDPDSKSNYIIEGDALTLEQDGYKLVFTKGEVPERFLPQEETEEVPDEGVEEVPSDIVEIPVD